MLGHSIGEYVAACVAGVFSLEDALRIVVLRGQLMQSLPQGEMLSVQLPESHLRDLMNGSLSLAAVNAPDLCVVSGPHIPIESLRTQLAAEGVKTQRLHTSHAFHSAMMEPILEEFATQVSQVRRNAPSIPFISNLTGKLVKAEEVMDPQYWAHHLRYTVQFATGLHTLLEQPRTIVLEVGPGQTLTGLIGQQHPDRSAGRTVVPLCRHPRDQQSDGSVLKQALGRLWLEGVTVVWQMLGEEGRECRRIPLPTYPFEKKRHWIERPALQSTSVPTSAEIEQGEVHLEANESVKLPGEPLPEVSQTAGGDDGFNGLEKQVLHIWEELFGIQQMSLDDNFFELGGNSLMAIQLMSQIRDTFGIEIELENMFDDPTIGGLVKQVAIALEVGKQQA
jgi:acyl transferase domain-containing protein/acyl carrier protein